MKKKATMWTLTLLITMMTTTPALALEYNVSDKAAGEFGKSTSVETVTVVGEEKLFNVRK